ncbi:MAG: YjzC family protein [Phycisphaerae bacterium]
MAAKKGLRPGEKAPNSGQYQKIGPRGGKGDEVTSVKGEPLPPTQTKGTTYTLVDPTKNKSGRK